MTPGVGSYLWARNLRAARRFVMAAAELGNRQSHIEPLGVMPGRLFIASR
jgi:hypothetical protein